MRIHHFTTYASIGGAGIAAGRLVEGLRADGKDARMFSVRAAASAVNWTEGVVFEQSLAEKLWCRLKQWQINKARSRLPSESVGGQPFFIDLSCFGRAMLRAARGADIIHFHWVSDLLDYAYVLPRLPKNVPVVWTLHDMTPATGGCIYAMDCQRFHHECGECPQLRSGRANDLSSEVWRRKHHALRQLRPPMTLVSPSRWLHDECRKSNLLSSYPCEVIPYGLDTQVFRPYEAASERQRLGLKSGVPVVLFTAASLSDSRKGFRYLLEAIPMVRARFPALQLAAIGAMEKGTSWPDDVVLLPAAETEEQMARVYSSADILVVPSLADNLPNVIMEALACGVPTAGFRIGGIPEMVVEGQTGSLAEEVSSASLADAMLRLLTDLSASREAWRNRCREYACEHFSLKTQSARYSKLYESLLAAG